MNKEALGKLIECARTGRPTKLIIVGEESEVQCPNGTPFTTTPMLGMIFRPPKTKPALSLSLSSESSSNILAISKLDIGFKRKILSQALRPDPRNWMVDAIQDAVIKGFKKESFDLESVKNVTGPLTFAPKYGHDGTPIAFNLINMPIT